MPSFTDLPIELLPLVVEHIFRPSYLAKFCLVNRVFQRFATPLLYQQLFIYAWHKDAKAKVCLKWLLHSDDTVISPTGCQDV